MSSRSDVFVGPSQNPLAGDGLYAARRFRAGELVADLTGPLVPVESLASPNRRYAVRWNSTLAIDTLATKYPSLGHKANAPRGDIFKRKANVKLSLDRLNKRAVLRAKRPIREYEEILFCYGSGYRWQKNKASERTK